MTWFPIFGAGFLVGWWVCAFTWPISDRRPKLPSLKKRALRTLAAVERDLRRPWIADTDTIRRALEQLDD
jgi:hypothetical protein